MSKQGDAIEALRAVFREAETMAMTMRRRKIFNAGRDALASLSSAEAAIRGGWDAIAEQLSGALSERNDDRFKIIAFVHRHSIIEALTRLVPTEAAIRADEREACAKVAEDNAEISRGKSDTLSRGFLAASMDIAKAIRSRGEGG